MLSKPDAGWTEFRLDGTSSYWLSYLDNIPLDWLNQAINGLETMLPFCVKGFMEPTRFLCVVSYWNCHIICEDEHRSPLNNSDTIRECSHTSMLQFCQYLYYDISSHLDDWVDFASSQSSQIIFSEDDDEINACKLLVQKLNEFCRLIDENQQCFGENRTFL